MRVPVQARMENPSQNPSQGGTNGVAAAAKRHIEMEFFILLIALRTIPNVMPLAVVILGQDPHQILSEKQGIIVAKNVPINPGNIKGNSIGDDTSDAVAGDKGRGIRGDEDGRE